MAQAWGRITGQPGVVLTTSGPGLINAVCGVATATEDRDPLVIVTGQVSRVMQFKPSHMKLDSENLYAPITKWRVEVEEPEILANAFRNAVLPRAGAVHVSVPTDVLTAHVKAAPIVALSSARLHPPRWNMRLNSFEPLRRRWFCWASGLGSGTALQPCGGFSTSTDCEST